MILYKKSLYFYFSTYLSTYWYIWQCLSTSLSVRWYLWLSLYLIVDISGFLSISLSISLLISLAVSLALSSLSPSPILSGLFWESFQRPPERPRNRMRRWRPQKNFIDRKKNFVSFLNRQENLFRLVLKLDNKQKNNIYCIIYMQGLQ